MNPLLDETEKQTNSSSLFAYLSLGFSILTILTLSYFISQIPDRFKVGDGLPTSFSAISTVMLTLFPLGILSTIISLVRKEPSSAVKLLGIILNSILLFVIVACIIFALTKDLG